MTNNKIKPVLLDYNKGFKKPIENGHCIAIFMELFREYYVINYKVEGEEISNLNY